MRVDLRHPFNDGMNNLSTWRNRYKKIDYPEKVLINMFYRKYTTEFLWNEIETCFQRKKLWSEYDEGLKKLKELFQDISISKTQPILMKYLSEQSDRKVGSVSYADYNYRIIGAKQGNKDDLEEIEFAYLFHFLADECVLLWAAFGGTGMDKNQAIGQLTGLILQTPEIKYYAHIEEILGRFCVASYLNKVYNPLPPL